jgi:Ras-related protein Rab-1A
VVTVVPEVYKAIVVGPRNVGKSSLVRRHMEDIFSETYKATVGADMKVTSMNFPEGDVVLTIVDLGGQESFSLLRSSFYQGAHHVMLVYDKTERLTFDEVVNWYEKLSMSFCGKDRRPVTGALVANKSDLLEKSEVTTAEGKQLADVLCLKYFETSAKTGEGVPELFLNAAIATRQMFQNLRQ